MEKRYNLILGDCIEELKDIKNESATLIFADPPYNLIGLDSFVDLNVYRRWSETWIDECFRILKRTGTFILAGRPPVLNYLCVDIADKGRVFREWITWNKVDSITASKDYYSRNFECFGVFSKWMQRKFNHIPIKSKTDNYSENRNAGCIWDHCKISKQHKEGTNHPTQKPIKFMERFVKTYTDIGDLVIDPFMGSGTTGEAAIRFDRKFIGMEINEEYYKISEKRIKEASEQTNLFPHKWSGD